MMQAFIIIVLAAAISLGIVYLLIKYAVISAIEYTGLGKAARQYTGDTKETLRMERKLSSFGTVPSSTTPGAQN